MASNKKVFIESNVFYAYVNRAHANHIQATSFFRYFAQEEFQVFTSYHVLEETYSLIYNKISPSLASDFLKGISLSSVNIIYPSEADLKSIIKTQVNYQNKDLTLRDTQSAVLANRNNISQICTFDYLRQLFGQTKYNLPF